jgi:hypothetical protein
MSKSTLKGVTAKMQMVKCFCHFVASWHLIFNIVIPSPIIDGEFWGVRPKIMKIKCSEAKKCQKQRLSICIFAVTPFTKILFTCGTELCFVGKQFGLSLEPKKYFSKHFWMLFNKIGKYCECNVVLHVKIRPQWMKIWK